MPNKVILNLAVSVDGFIADDDGGYGWIVPSGDSAVNTAEKWSHEAFLSHVGAVVMGKRCYEQQMHAEYCEKQVYVVTSGAGGDEGNIHFVNAGNITGEIRALRQTADGDIYLFGGGVSIDPILKAGLIDEYIVGIIPIILGSGIPLFLQGNPAIPLHLTHCYVEDGVVVLRYVPREAQAGL